MLITISFRPMAIAELAVNPILVLATVPALHLG